MIRSLYLSLAGAMVALAITVSPGCDKDDKTVDPGNQSPVITSLSADPDTFYMGSSTIVTVIADDPDGDALNYNWEIHGLDLLPVSGESNTIELTTCCPVFEPTTAMVLSIVDDGRGGEDCDSIEVCILPLR